MLMGFPPLPPPRDSNYFGYNAARYFISKLEKEVEAKIAQAILTAS